MTDKDESLTLFCLHDGLPTQRKIAIRASPSHTVAHLKTLIKTKLPLALHDIEGDQLTLWRVSILYDGNHNDISILLKNLSAEEKTKLDDPEALLSGVFTREPPETIHIIYQRPPVAGLEADLNKIAEKFFNSTTRPYAKFLKEFVQGFHELPVRCGKTRTAMDLLSRSWGLYFNASSGDYGSDDMNQIIETLMCHPNIYLSANDKKRNTERVRQLAFGLAYARLLILEHCLRIAAGNKDTDTFTCQRWMLLQVATPAFRDVFFSLFADIGLYLRTHYKDVSSLMMQSIVHERFESVQRLVRNRTSSAAAVHSKFLVVLDESQKLSKVFPTYFLDDRDSEMAQPVLAPILHVFMGLEEKWLDERKTCVLPCSTTVNTLYEPKWTGDGSAQSDDNDDFSGMVVDFDGWTHVASVANYLERLGQGLDDDARERKARVERLIPPEAALRLFRNLRGRFGPIVSAIEDILSENDPTAWEDCINFRVDMNAKAPSNEYELRNFRGNLCVELLCMIRLVKQQQEQSDIKAAAIAEVRNLQATLKLALTTFKTHNKYLALRGWLSRLVETGFGRIRLIDGVIHTTIDEPFALRAAENYFRWLDDVVDDNDSQMGRRSIGETAEAEAEAAATFDCEESWMFVIENMA
ncbi:hypothetical protein BGZ95_011248 [Linnemannia exigua]|uniref:Crinkler effector protein N-terminal domain-containing protein n=1 Tax=Linnemannia exigua TaxID=604196 RepID=A0AAD4DAQ0_9FUNG|nr:hypothetical protein BGZ95_011248 [Linnemannia exigua]